MVYSIICYKDSTRMLIYVCVNIYSMCGVCGRVWYDIYTACGDVCVRVWVYDIYNVCECCVCVCVCVSDVMRVWCGACRRRGESGVVSPRRVCVLRLSSSLSLPSRSSSRECAEESAESRASAG